jgi:energy-converting hydrogenase B subunit D
VTVALSVALTMTAVVGTIVVLIREPVRQALAAAVYGLVLGVLFFLLRAPDVALSEIAVGTVLLPLMIMLALARIREDRQ